MGLGREVADAYIQVHGDLSDFRRDLEKARPAIKRAAMKQAEEFGKAWNEQLQKDIAGKWDDMVKTMYSGEKIDFNKLIESFDSSDLDEADKKMKRFMQTMLQNGRFTNEQYQATKAAMAGHLEDLRATRAEEERLTQVTRAHMDALRDDNAWMQRRSDTMAEAIRENERWARTFDGMAKNGSIAKMESDFKGLAEAVSGADFSSFAKSFDSFPDLRRRVTEITDAMREQGRVTDDNTAKIHSSMEAYIADAEAKSRAEADALTNARLLREEQERYNRSLDGMIRASAYQKQERDFKMLTEAIRSGDWSKIGKGAQDMEDFRNNTQRAVNEMHRVGRITDEEFSRISAKVTEVSGDLERYNVHIDEGREGIERHGNSLDGFGRKLLTVGRGLRGFGQHLAGFAGLNVFGDMISEGLDFIHNLDRIGVHAAQTALKLSAMASVGGNALMGLITVAADLGTVIGGSLALAPGYLIGAGIGIGVLVAAFKDTKTVLKDLKPLFAQFQNDISSDFWSKAAGPIRNLVKNMMPLLDNPKGTSTAASLGTLFGKLATAIDQVDDKKITTMFDRMNGAIDILGGAMKPLVNAFTTLGLHASKTFGGFAGWLKDLSVRFDNFIQKASGDGRLDRWINDAIQGFKDIGTVIGGTFDIFGALNKAAEAAGSTGLHGFAAAVDAIAKKMNSDEFQKPLIQLFSGMKQGAESIGRAILNLGPAMTSVMPTINLALVSLGDSVGVIIGFLGEILSNPTVQRGITDFTTSVNNALRGLQPAVKPFSDSIGNALTLLGKVVESVSKIATAFTVNLGPILDQMSIKLQTLIDPLRDSALNAVNTLTPVFQTLDSAVVGPLVAAFRTDLIPAIDDFVKAAGPFLSKIAEDLGPILTVLAKDVLPPILKTAGELLTPLGALFDLFTPGLKDIATGIGVAFQNFADSLKSFNEWADPAYKSMGKIKDRMKEMDGFKISTTTSPVADLIAKYTIAAIAADPVIATFAVFFGKLTKGWTESLSAFILGVSDPKTFAVNIAANMANNLPNWMFGEFKIADFAVAVGTWLDLNIYTPLQTAWQTFLVKLALIFVGGGGDSGSGGDSSGGTPMGGMAVGAKIMPQMIDAESEKTFLDTFIAGITEKIGGWGALIGGAFGLWTGSTQLTWDNFWNGLPGATEGGMGQSSAKVATHTVAMGTSIGGFIAQNAPAWAGFFTDSQQQASTNMGAAATTVAGKTLAMTGSIGTFSTNAKTTWTTALAGMAQSAVQQWGAMSGTTTSKAAAIAVTVAAKMGLVKTDTDTSLARVAALFVQHFTTAKTEVEGSLGTIVGKFSGLAGRITTALAGLKGSLEAIGGDAMDGMKAGIDAKSGLIASAAAAVVAGAIAAAREAQKSNSPSKVYRSLGWDAGDGLVLGFGDSESPVADAAASMAEAAIGVFAKSKMYAAGSQAALGLADGLKDNKSLVTAAFADLMPVTSGTTFGIGSGTAGVGTPTPPAGNTYVTVEAGAIPVTTPTKSPELVASKVIDGLIESFSTL